MRAPAHGQDEKGRARARPFSSCPFRVAEAAVLVAAPEDPVSARIADRISDRILIGSLTASAVQDRGEDLRQRLLRVLAGAGAAPGHVLVGTDQERAGTSDLPDGLP